MTIGPNGEIRIETLGDLKDEGYGISWYCEAHNCRRSLSLTLDRAIEMWGRDRSHIAQTWKGIRCGGCGGRKISISLRPPPYSQEKGR